MHVIVTCKYEKEQIKNSREKVETPFFSIITLSVTMETSSWIWANFKLIQALMYEGRLINSRNSPLIDLLLYQIT